MRIIRWFQTVFLALLKFYLAGLSETIVIVVSIILITLLVNAAEPMEAFLAYFIPTQYFFPQIGLIFLVAILPFVIHSLTKLGMRRFLNRFFRKVPFLNFLFGERGSQEGIPVAAKQENGLVYGFLRGRSIIYDNTGFIESGCIWWSVFIPSSPVPATSLFPKDFRPEDVREVEIIDQEGRNHARAAIIRKCINLGESLGNIRLKIIEEVEVEKLPILFQKDKKNRK